MYRLFSSDQSAELERRPAIELLFFLVRGLLGPWAKHDARLPPLSYRVSNVDLSSLFLLIVFANIWSYFTWHPTRDWLQYYLPPTLGAGIVWFHAIYAMRLHRITDPKRRFAASFLIFPIAYVSVFVVVLCGATAFFCFLLKETPQAINNLIAIVVAIASMFLARALSRWVLPPPPKSS